MKEDVGTSKLTSKVCKQGLDGTNSGDSLGNLYVSDSDNNRLVVL